MVLCDVYQHGPRRRCLTVPVAAHQYVYSVDVAYAARRNCIRLSVLNIAQKCSRFCTKDYVLIFKRRRSR